MSDPTWTKITVRDPLPLDVAGSLIQLIGAAWPDARISTDETASLAMLVPTSAAPKVGKKHARAVVAANEAAAVDTDGAALAAIGDDSVTVIPPEQLQQELTFLVHTLMSANPEAVNYLTWGVTYQGNDITPACTYELTVRRNGGESPADKIRRAVEALDAADFALAHRILTNAPPGPQPDRSLSRNDGQEP